MEPTSGVIAGILAKLGLPGIPLLVASFIGAALSPVLANGMSFRQMFLSMVVGFFSSAYGTPAIIYYVGLSDAPESIGYALAFAIGLTAMSVIPMGLAWLKGRTGAKS
jgi:hypothetical protein